MSDAITAIAIPKWGIEMVEGTVVSWTKQAGDTVAKGDEIAEIESDKIVNSLEAPASGTIRRLLVEEGEALKVGALIGLIAGNSVTEAALDEFIADYVPPEHSGDDTVAQPELVVSPAQEPVGGSPSTGGVAPRGRVSPVVRRLAKKLNVDLDSVQGSGAGGRITAVDVEQAAAGAPSGDVEAPPFQASNPATVTALSSMRKTIARRLVESKQTVPHFYLSADIEIDRLLEVRMAINARGGQSVSINDLLVYCAAGALMDVPEVNAHLIGDEIHQFRHADICVAVATDRGLLTPVLGRAESRQPVDIAVETTALVEKARSGTLQRADVTGGTFTVSNLGMFGINRFDAIINPPQVAILALGRATQQPVVHDGEVTVRTVLSANLSCDHRVIDGALGGRFLSAFRNRAAQLTA